ncbi:HAD family hydrolase [Exiguobacterium sp. UBA7533]|uniref:HAD family hydrolase n=1 Tax=Exiguobacterium sp. UBA7533 TaxID=1946501 RepID=UPI0025C62F56|nr:HAD family hydrolase [Exiguobacterium sp. UBA7533]
MIRALLFDLDETLHDRSGSLPSFLENQYERFSAQISPIALDEYVSVFLELDQGGRVWKDVVYAEMIRLFQLSLSIEVLLHDYVTRYPIFALSFPGVTTFFAQLPPELPIGLLSNGRTLFQRAVLDAIALTSAFTQIGISEQEGLRKPDPGFFLRVTERLSVRPEEVLFVGDNYDHDILPARALGMQTIRKRTGDVALTDAQFSDWYQLPLTLHNLIPKETHL